METANTGHFDVPIQEQLLDFNADQLKRQGYDKNAMPLGHVFAGQQSKDFYLGMIAAFGILDIALLQQDISEMSIPEMNTFLLAHATMLAHQKKSRIITSL